MSIIYSLRSSNYWDTNVSNKQYRFALLVITVTTNVKKLTERHGWWWKQCVSTLTTKKKDSI